jgi:hypothetical protein
LSALATAVDAFDGDQFSARGHFLRCPGKAGAKVERQSNRRVSALQRRAC